MFYKTNSLHARHSGALIQSLLMRRKQQLDVWSEPDTTTTGDKKIRRVRTAWFNVRRTPFAYRCTEPAWLRVFCCVTTCALSCSSFLTREEKKHTPLSLQKRMS